METQNCKNAEHSMEMSYKNSNIKGFHGDILECSFIHISFVVIVLFFYFLYFFSGKTQTFNKITLLLGILSISPSSDLTVNSSTAFFTTAKAIEDSVRYNASYIFMFHFCVGEN